METQDKEKVNNIQLPDDYRFRLYDKFRGLDVDNYINNKLDERLKFNVLCNTNNPNFKDFQKKYNLDFIAGIEARGFLFGAALASRLKIGFVPIRKKGKLPSTTLCEKYELEYGFDEVEVHFDAFRDIKNPRVMLPCVCASGPPKIPSVVRTTAVAITPHAIEPAANLVIPT